ncbi:MAG: SurA N-terminal domain-containing protein [Bdellovibrio sp.]|nr:SurA N-terminal domain-containing protein [Bdellovibrio sp.]
MKETFQHKTSSILVSGLIGLIIISFMFTGYESMKGTPDTIAKVGKHPIKIREYQQEYDRQLQFYSNYMSGGNPLTEEQIRNFGIKDNTLKSLVSRRLFINFAEQLGIMPAPEQIKDKVKELEYFKTNGQFDLQRYKAILANARITPADFEEDLADQVKAQNAQEFISTYPLSESYLADVIKYKSEITKLEVVQLNRRNLTKFVNVSKNEIDQFLSQPTNMERVKNLFGSRKKSLDLSEAVKGRHILFTMQGGKKKIEDLEKEALALRKELTIGNFAKIADKKTEDPAGKGKGGALDWFERGQMVPEFEKVAFELKPNTISDPIKTSYGIHIILVEEHRAGKEAQLVAHQESLARELLQGEKTKELDELIKTLSQQTTDFLKNKKSAELAALVKKYELLHLPKAIMNRLDGSLGQIRLTAAQVQQVFSGDGSDKDVFLFNDTLSTLAVKKSELTSKDKESHAIRKEEEIEKINSQMARKLGQDIIKTLEGSVKVKMFRPDINS